MVAAVPRESGLAIEPAKLDVSSRSVASRALQGFITHFFLRLRGLLLVPVLARLLGPEDLGVVTLAGALVGLCAPLLSLGLPVGISMGLVNERDPSAFARGWSTGLKLALLSATVGGAFAALIVASPLGGDAVAPLRPHARAVALLLSVTVLREVAISVPQLRQETGFVAAFNLLVDYGATLLAVALVFWGWGPAGALWAQGAVLAAGIGIACLHTGAQCGWSGRFDPVFLKSALAVGLPVLPIGFGQWALQSLDSFFLAAWHGKAAVGSYGLAYTLASPVTLVLATLNFVYFPTASAMLREGRERLLPFLSRSYRLVVAAVGLFVCGAFLLAPWGVRLLAGPGYDRSAQVLPLVASAWGIFTLLQLLQFVEVVVERRTTRIAAAYVAMTGLNLVLNLALIPRFALHGAAVATLLSYAGGTALMARLAGRALPEFRWGAPVAAGAAPAVLLVLPAALLAVPAGAPLLQAASAAAALVGLYAGLARMLGAISGDDWELALSLRGRRR